MNEHTNIETMNDKIFQSDKLESLFKSFSVGSWPVIFLKTTFVEASRKRFLSINVLNWETELIGAIFLSFYSQMYRLAL